MKPNPKGASNPQVQKDAEAEKVRDGRKLSGKRVGSESVHPCFPDVNCCVLAESSGVSHHPSTAALHIQLILSVVV